MRCPGPHAHREGGEADRLDLLLSGADGSLGRPISLPAMLGQASRLLQRQRSTSGRPIRREIAVGDLRIDLTRELVYVGSRTIDLSPPEFRLLAALSAKQGTEVSREELLAQVWGPEYADHEAYLDLYVFSLRRRIEEDPSSPRYLHEDEGTGYRLGGN